MINKLCTSFFLSVLLLVFSTACVSDTKSDAPVMQVSTADEAKRIACNYAKKTLGEEQFKEYDRVTVSDGKMWFVFFTTESRAVMLDHDFAIIIEKESGKIHYDGPNPDNQPNLKQGKK